MSSPLLPPAPQASREESVPGLVHQARDLLLAALAAAGHAALARALALLLSLFEKWQAGTLPPPPAPRPAVQQASRPAPAPRRFAPLAWLMGLFTPNIPTPSFRASCAPRQFVPRPRRPAMRSGSVTEPCATPHPRAEAPPVTRSKRQARRPRAPRPRRILAPYALRTIRRAGRHARAGPCRKNPANPGATARSIYYDIISLRIIHPAAPAKPAPASPACPASRPRPAKSHPSARSSPPALHRPPPPRRSP